MSEQKKSGFSKEFKKPDVKAEKPEQVEVPVVEEVKAEAPQVEEVKPEPKAEAPAPAPAPKAEAPKLLFGAAKLRARRRGR